MVHNCAIISCPLHNRRNIRKGLLFHSFPVDQHRFELWRQTVFNHCSQTLSINRHSKICYRHFLPDDYIANHTGLTRYLKATAIPSMFTDTTANQSLFNTHLLASSTELTTNRHLTAQTASSSLLLLPSKSASTVATPSTTDTKVKRLLSTIDKLHQIQNANKVVGTTKLNLDNEEKNNLLGDDSLKIARMLRIEHDDASKEPQPLVQDTPQPSPREVDARRSVDNTIMSAPKGHLEDALFEFLEQANLLQYYPAFIEQGGDDLKQLAEAQNDDFQEIITLVGMTSKPLHIKRFKKALADYRQSTRNTGTSHSVMTDSYSPSPLRCRSAGESFTDRHLLSPFLLSTSTNNACKLANPVSTNWNLNRMDACKSNNTHQLLDDSQRKLIADEAERLANLLPLTTVKKFNGHNHISKDIFATINLPRDFEDRWQRIRKYSAIYNRFDSKKPNEVMSLHEILINEAAAAICFHRPEFLTRRDELLHLARRVLQNIGVTTNTVLKRPLSMLTCDVTPPKQVRLTLPLPKPTTRQRDPDTFRLMWRNRETKVEQIPMEIEALRCEQNKLLQQLKQNTMDSSLSLDTGALKKQIDELSKKIEQLSDEEKNLRRLIRKKNMRLRAKERQQQKQLITTNHSSAIPDPMLPLAPVTPSPHPSSGETEHGHRSASLSMQQSDPTSNNAHRVVQIKEEQVELPVPLTSPVLKARKALESEFMPKAIDRRREEVNDRPLILNRKSNDSIDRSARSIQRKQSSSTTAIDASSHSHAFADRLPAGRTEEDVVESKSFIHNLDFNMNILKENE